MSQPANSSSGFTRRMWLILIGLAIVVVMVVAIAVGMALGYNAVKLPTPAAIAPTPTAPRDTVTPISPPSVPQAIASPATASAGSTFTVLGTGWTPSDTVAIFLRDPARPSDPIMSLGASQVTADGRFSATLSYPTDVRWATLPKADIVVQSASTGLYITTSLSIQLPSPTPTATDRIRANGGQSSG